MGQVNPKRKFAANLSAKVIGIFISEPVSFSNKRKINFRGLAWFTCVFLTLFCVAVLVMPAEEIQTKTYHEQSRESSSQPVNGAQTFATSDGTASSPNPYTVGYPAPTGGGQPSNRNTSMIIARDNDPSTTLPPGTKFWVKLAQAVTVTGQAMPVIGVVASSVSSGNSLAIPEGAHVFGDASLDADSERASVTWKSMMFPDGRSKTLSALALGLDNQAGIEGDYHSDALKNTVGQFVAHFVQGVAEGAITRTPFGASQGGIQNGLLQGAADTAKDRTDALSADLKKPRAWIELQTGVQFQVILSQPFTFRDPGGVN